MTKQENIVYKYFVEIFSTRTDLGTLKISRDKMFKILRHYFFPKTICTLMIKEMENLKMITRVPYKQQSPAYILNWSGIKIEDDTSRLYEQVGFWKS